MPAIAKEKIRVAVADREGVFRLGLKKLFGVEEDLWVVAEAETLEGFAELVCEFKPDLIFMQAELANAADRSEMISRLNRAAEGSKIVITASALAEKPSLEWIRSGARGVILKSVDPPLFVKCARKVASGELWLPKKQVAEMATLLDPPKDQPARPRDTLTVREKTIIGFLMEGCRNREIARRLSISEQTVKNHLRTVYNKVGVSDRLELVLYAIHQNLPLAAPDSEVSPSMSSS